MPRVNIYITNDNWDRWQRLSNKSAYVNDHLRYDVGAAVRVTRNVANTARNDASAAQQLEQNSNYCPHGQARGSCEYGCQ